MDLSIFNSVPGLLSAEQQGNANSQGLLSMAAGLLQAAGPSPYKNTTLSGIGQGVQAGIQGYNQGIDQGLKQQLTRGQITSGATSQLTQLLALSRKYQENNLPVPPQIQK